jgi:hypothetical protein
LTAIATHKPAATLVLDPTGRAGVFFKYKGITINSALEAERQETFVRNRAKFAITGGGTLVFLLSPDYPLQAYFNERSFLPETLMLSELTEEKLEIYRDQDAAGEYLRVEDSFSLVVHLKSDVVPAWAVELVEAGRLRPIIVTIAD